MVRNRIKVLVIDDSAVIRHLLTEILEEAEDIEVVGTAIDPLFAMRKIESLNPDVITLDVEMPRMDGLTFLQELMLNNPTPVVMVSALTQKGCETTVKALELGAIDYVEKPSLDIKGNVADKASEIIAKVRTASTAKVRNISAKVSPSGLTKATPPSLPPAGSPSPMHKTTDKIIAIGSSTGGTQAVSEILSMLPESVPGIVIAQHMPPLFTRSFAERLRHITRLDAKEAEKGDRVIRGNVLVAPGNEHLTIDRNGAMYYASLDQGPPVNFTRPSVDVLFRSVARAAGKNAVGVILTGMGEDGARGLLDMRRAGAHTIAQDEKTSVIYGMPKRAAELGAADEILPLERIAKAILRRI